MVNRIALSATLVLLGISAVASNANAQTSDVNFSGNVPTLCSFTQVQDGQLGIGTDKNSLGSSSAGNYDAPAASGKAALSCNAGATISISDPVKTVSTGTAVADVRNEATFSTDQGLVKSPSAGGTTVSFPGAFVQSAGNVDLDLGYSALTPGTYNYTTTITVAP